jgi:ribosomal protein S27E
VNAAREVARTLAGAQVAKAVREGRLVRLRKVYVKCTDCDDRATVYDHRNYDNPLDVAPVCQSCNLRRGKATFTPRDTSGFKVRYSIKVPDAEYQLLAARSKATGRSITWLLARAIDRYCGKPKP